MWSFSACIPPVLKLTALANQKHKGAGLIATLIYSASAALIPCGTWRRVNQSEAAIHEPTAYTRPQPQCKQTHAAAAGGLRAEVSFRHSYNAQEKQHACYMGLFRFLNVRCASETGSL